MMKYCKVCKNYDAYKGSCRKGWNIHLGIYCNKEDFEPDILIAGLNLLYLLGNKIDERTRNEMERVLYKEMEGEK